MMMGKDDTQQRVNKKFIMTIRKTFPGKSMSQVTKDIAPLIDEFDRLLGYGKKKK